MSESHELKPYTLADAIRHAVIAAALHHEARHVIEHGGEFHAVEPGELREWLIAGAMLHGSARGGAAPVYYPLRDTAGRIARNESPVVICRQRPAAAFNWRDGLFQTVHRREARYVEWPGTTPSGGWVALDTGEVFLNWRWA